MLGMLFIIIVGCRPEAIPATSEVKDTFNSNNRNRAAWQKPSLVIDHLGDISDKTVADIGAGTGYFAFRLAYKADRVVAVEIDQDMIALMDGIKINLPAEMQAHFETRLGTTNDPNLRPEEADIALIINTITYIERPVPYLRRLGEGLSPGGSVTILDYKKDHPIPLADVPVSEERYSYQEVQDLLTGAGYAITHIDTTTLSYQYMITGTRS